MNLSSLALLCNVIGSAIVLVYVVYAIIKYSHKIFLTLIGVYMAVLGGTSLYFLLTGGATTTVFIVMLGMNILLMMVLSVYGS